MPFSDYVNKVRRSAREVEFDGGGAYEVAVDIDYLSEEVIIEFRRDECTFGIEIVLSPSKPETKVLMSQCDGETFGAFVSFLDCMKVLEVA